MTKTTNLTATDIRQARIDNPKMRERDLADKLEISEAEYIAAWCGETTKRITVDMDAIFGGLEAVGEVLALTRNENAVHEKIGVYDSYHSGKHASMMLGANIDTRMFPKHFIHAFAIEKPTEDGIKRSLQFFDAQGDAVHKIHLRDASDIEAWDALLAPLVSDDQSQSVVCEPANVVELHENPQSVAEQLREKWQAMTDTHQFVFIVRKLKITRHQAVCIAGDDLAWQLDKDAVGAMLRHSANEELPIMCFVGSQGCIQIHCGPIESIKTMGPWLNIMDSNFHLHLRDDKIAEVWAVRKPSDKGHVTSLEAYDADGNLIIQFFGKRVEGNDERPQWRFIMENLPRITRNEAA